MSGAKLTASLADEITDATDKLLNRQTDMVRLASNKNKTDAAIAVDSAEIEVCAASMVKSVEDLLVVTRRLKEAWALGQVRRPLAEISPDEQARRRSAAASVVAKLSE